MLRLTLPNTARLLAAGFFLFFAIFIWLPNPHCKCHSPVKTKSESCSFGQIRKLTGSVLFSPSPALPLPVMVFHPEPTYLLLSARLVLVRLNDPRGPPAALG